MAANKTLAEPGYQLSQSNNKVLAGTGKVLASTGTGLDFGVAAIHKLPLPAVSRVDQAVRETKVAYETAVKEVGVTGGLVYGWMHSEGAIHGSYVIANAVNDVNLNRLRINTLGGAEHGFPKGVVATHWVTRNKERRRDAVPTIAAGDWRPRRIPIVSWIPFVGSALTHPEEVQYVDNCEEVTAHYTQGTGDPNYVHGFVTYAKYVIVPLATKYFEDVARDIVGH
jgi:hypothetical protein